MDRIEAEWADTERLMLSCREQLRQAEANLQAIQRFVGPENEITQNTVYVARYRYTEIPDFLRTVLDFMLLFYDLSTFCRTQEDVWNYFDFDWAIMHTVRHYQTRIRLLRNDMRRYQRRFPHLIRSQMEALDRYVVQVQSPVQEIVQQFSSLGL